MATQVVTRKLCDFCLADGTDNDDAMTLTVSLNGDTFEIDSCPPHAAPLQALAETLAEHGRKVPRRGRPIKAGNGNGNGNGNGQHVPPPLTCPACGNVAGGTDPMRNLRNHTAQVHNRSVEQLFNEPAPFACGHDGCGMAFPTDQQRKSHEQRKHKQIT